MKNIAPYKNASRAANIYFDADLASTLFDILYTSTDIQSSLNLALKILGEKLHVDRCYIFETFDDGETYDNTYEWCKAGISVEINNLQGIPKETLADFFTGATKDGIIYSNDLTILKGDGAYDIMAAQGIKSFLHSQTTSHGFAKEFIGIDDCQTPRIWREKEINSLLYARKIISVFLLIENSNQCNLRK